MATTGEDAQESGTYVSQCCQEKVEVEQGESLPPCPKCNESAEYSKES